LARIARIFLAGLLVLLPILVTVIVTAWVAQLLQTYAGPNSLIGRLIVLLGLNLASSDTGAYFLGFLIILCCIFLLGLFVETRLWPLVQTGLDSLISRIPLVSNVYELSKRPSSIAAGTRTICKACARYGASSAGRGALRCSG
jgi:uncharacterized membrane protein